MPVQPGQMLSHYRLIERLGEGGMGVVWKALDTTLDREVAIKILPDEFAADPERMARFEREAKLLASLNHPNIASVFGLHESDGIRFISMELVPGEDLAQRLGRGAIPVQEALDLAVQICDALQVAHESGVIHRDLKPANIRITEQGKVKVLDFGLAKSFGDRPALSDPSLSPTVTSDHTWAGVILGTAAYMSPEQARGRPLDKRSDIWSFGCCLFEALTGKKAFDGETVSDTLARIIEREPEWGMLPASVPPPIRRLLHRCLRKKPEERLHDIADARIEIGEWQDGVTSEEPAPAPRRAGAWSAVGALSGLLALCLAIGAWGWLRPTRTPPRSPVRFTVDLSPGITFESWTAPMISPDGRRIVLATLKGARSQLHMRDLETLETVELPGTEEVDDAFFSPDGRFIVFGVEGKLKKLALDGGPPVDICEAGLSAGGCWASDGTILFNADWTGGLMRVSSAGGIPEALTKVKEGEAGHWWPALLPDGEHVLFTIYRTCLNDTDIGLASLATGEHRVLISGASYARYVPTGHLIFPRENMLLAVPFDLERLELTGDPVQIQDDLSVVPLYGTSRSTFSDTGTLAYRPGGSWLASRRLVWIDRQGKTEPLAVEERAYMGVSISPDGRYAALTIFENGVMSLHIHDLDSGMTSQLTFGHDDFQPVWSPDGTRLAFTTARNGDFDIYAIPVDRSSSANAVVTGPYDQIARDWSPDGWLLYRTLDPKTGLDIMAHAVEGGEQVLEVLKTPASEWDGCFSPDGVWVAYCSTVSGVPEVYLRSFSGSGGIRQVSHGGGAEPRWSADGRELFYWKGRHLMAVDMDIRSGQPLPGKPRELPSLDLYAGWSSWDYHAASDRFLMIQESENEVWNDSFVVVLDWFEELRRKLGDSNAQN